MTYYNRRTYRHDVSASELSEDMLAAARSGDATVNLWETVRDWVLERPMDDVESAYGGDILVSIPNTYPNTFGNGSTIDRANRKAIEDGALGVLSAYIEEHPAVGGPLALNVSDLLEDGGEHFDADGLESVQLMLDTIDGLRDYPILDEEIWSQVEDDENHENWMDYGAHDTGILRDGESFKDDDGSIPLAILQGYWIEPHHMGDGPLTVEHTGYDTTFLIDPEDVERARAMIAEYIVAED